MVTEVCKLLERARLSTDDWQNTGHHEQRRNSAGATGAAPLYADTGMVNGMSQRAGYLEY